jgi:hypothetical protein
MLQPTILLLELLLLLCCLLALGSCLLLHASVLQLLSKHITLCLGCCCGAHCLPNGCLQQHEQQQNMLCDTTETSALRDDVAKPHNVQVVTVAS